MSLYIKVEINIAMAAVEIPAINTLHYRPFLLSRELINKFAY